MPQSQSQKLIEHLQTHKSITQLEAQLHYGIMRLASRISELSPYHTILRKTCKDSGGKRYTKYIYKGRKTYDQLDSRAFNPSRKRRGAATG